MRHQLVAVPLDLVRIDGGTQPRVEISEATVAEYAEAIAEGASLPPVVVFFDGTDYWLADGFHRYHAHRRAEVGALDAEVHAGDRRAAVLYAVGANDKHGLRRTNADKRKAVETLLKDAEWREFSDSEIGRLCGVAQSFVHSVRSSLVTEIGEPPKHRIYVTKHGTQATMNVANLRLKSKKQAVKPNRGKEPPPAEVVPDEAPTASEMLEEMRADLEKAHAELKAAEATDKAAEILKWKRIADVAQQRQNEAMDQVKVVERREEWALRQLRRCGRAVGVVDLDRIAPAVEASVRNREVRQ